MKVFIDPACKIGPQIAMLALKDFLQCGGKIGIIMDHHEISCSVSNNYL